MSDPGAIRLEPVTDRAWLTGFIAEHWGAPGAVSRGRLWTGDELTAIRAMHGDQVAGVVAWAAEADGWQLVVLNSLIPGCGIGTRLVEAVVEMAHRAGAPRLWVITTNDNLDALRFYQRRGFRIAAVHAGVIAESRRIKPGIPKVGGYGIPVRDEIELEYAP